MPNSPLGPVSSVGEPLQAGDPALSWPGSDCKTIRSGYIFQIVQTQIIIIHGVQVQYTVGIVETPTKAYKKS